MSQRINWIDCWKGIAIVTVVAGHVFSELKIAKYIFWFHMPLFFFISGYLYKEKYDYLAFFKKKFFHLIVPYISFLILFSLPTLATYIQEIWQNEQSDSLYQLLSFAFQQLYGGQILTGRFGIFWFVTCLFFTQQIYNFIYTKFCSDKWLINIIMLNFYCLAMIDCWFFNDINFPWNVNVVLMALPFYWFGHIVSEKPAIFNSKKLVFTACIVFLMQFLIDNLFLIGISFDMKSSSYGIPIINLLVAFSGIIIVQYLAKIVNKIKFINSISRQLGTASMVIMYLHQPIQLGLQKISFLNEGIIRLIAGLFIPYIIYKVIINFSMTRKYFLGEYKSVSGIKLKSLSKV
ncbi:acyltransferase family protein [Calothrix sp. CCY 0018]|uniref:acyltransferase family protein n=1 Tax=Calothrix sp. CCY 0018 TaxID=3103864 RepID=UPI0039C626DA